MKRFILILIPLMFVLQACSGKAESVPTEVPIELQVTEIPSTEAAQISIVHTDIPQGGTEERAYAHDNENSNNFDNKDVRFGDEFQKNRFERPFTANDMQYLPDIDIMDFGITSDDQFFYIRIILSGLDPATNTLTGFYGVEIDQNADGRAELMLATKPPYSSEFTPNNVVAFADFNGDIGGPTINRPDEGFAGDGYEGIVFDLSQNIHPDDPDLLWARFVEGDKPAIEIAYKKWIFKDVGERFMWSVFAFDTSQGITAKNFNIHDTISEVDAGSPNKGNANYPIKSLAAMDNTCRVPMGFQANGSEPLGCFVNGPDVAVTVEEKDDGNTSGGGGGVKFGLPQLCLFNPVFCK